MFKKLLVSVLIGITFLFSSAPFLQAKAQTSWYNQTFPEWYLKVYDSTNPNEIFGERYTAAQVQWIVYSIPSLIINLVTGGNNDIGSCLVGIASLNFDATKCDISTVEYLKSFVSAIKIGYNPKDTPNIASQIFNRKELSGIGYVRGVVSKLNPVTTISAQTSDQGYGISVLKPVAFIWKITRNISYLFFVLVAVIFSFMIMFRVKLSPQTVVTIQSSLPKLIIALILVTFSFAIAGLLVDLMYVVMALVSTLLGPLAGDGPKFIFNFINGSTLPFFSGGLALLLYFVIYLLLYLVALIAIAVSAVLGLNISSAIFAILLLVFWVILILILVWNIFKVTYVLFKNLAEVYGLIIIAPLQITLGALYPQAGFSSWMKKFVSKIMIFPLTGIFIYIAMVLLLYSIRLSLNGLLNNNILANLWEGGIKPLMDLLGMNTSSYLNITGNWAPPMLGNPASASGIAFLLMSVGLIMMIPKIGESIESFLAGKGIAGTAIGEAMGPFGGLAKQAGGVATAYGGEYGAMGLANILKSSKYSDNKVVQGLVKALKGYSGKVEKMSTKSPGELR